MLILWKTIKNIIVRRKNRCGQTVDKKSKTFIFIHKLIK